MPNGFVTLGQVVQIILLIKGENYESISYRH